MRHPRGGARGDVGRGRRASRSTWVVAISIVACICGACGTQAASGSRTSNSTPPASVANATREFLARDGATLIDFELATEPLARGERPARANCAAVRSTIAPLVTDRVGLERLLAHLPDRRLEHLFRSDIANKSFLLDACLSATGLNDSAEEAREFQRISGTTRTLERALARSGVEVRAGVHD